MKDCNQGRHWFWKLLWDACSWKELSCVATLYGDTDISEQCRNCGRIRFRSIPGGP